MLASDGEGGGGKNSFQSPVEIPGVSNTDFLRLACNARRKELGLPELDPIEFYGFLAPKVRPPPPPPRLSPF